MRKSQDNGSQETIDIVFNSSWQESKVAEGRFARDLSDSVSHCQDHGFEPGSIGAESAERCFQFQSGWETTTRADVQSFA